MEEHPEDDIDDIDFSTYNHVLNKMRKKTSKRYEFITKAGESLHLALFNLFRSIWLNEKIPQSWHESILVQLSKGRGRPGDLKNMRHIHLRNIYLSFFSQIVMHFIKDTLIDNMSMYQIACKPGYRPSEHLFTIKSLISYYKKEKMSFLSSNLDISKFYDSE